jgi:NitT/TauT family transport system permease protein
VTAAAIRYLPLVALLALWEAATRSGLVSPLALPTLSSVLVAWVGLVTDGQLLSHTAASLMRGACGLGLAIVVGTSLGVLMAWVAPVRFVFRPIVQMFYPLPKSALIPILMIWLGFGDASKIAVIFLGCMLPVTLSAYNGARGVDRTLIWSARSLGATRPQVLLGIVAPAALPEILAGIRTALALSFLLLVSSELVVSREGLGYLISMLGDGGVYGGMFAVVLTVSALGFFADRAWLRFTRWSLAWRE